MTEGRKLLFSLDGDSIKTSLQLRDEVGGQRRAGRQMEESPVQTRKGVTRKCDESRADDQRPTEHANGAGTSRRKKAVVVKRVVKKKGGSDTSQDKVSTAVHAATNGLDQRDHIQKDAEARGKMDSKGSLLLSELIDDSDDDFSNMCRGPGERAVYDLNEGDPMAFLVKESNGFCEQRSSECLTNSLPDSSSPPVPKFSPPSLPLPVSSATDSDTPPPPLPTSPIPGTSPLSSGISSYNNVDGDGDAVTSLKAEVSRVHQEKLVAVKEKERLQQQLDQVLGSTDMMHEAKKELQVMRSERRDSALSEQVLKKQLKNRHQETNHLQKETASLKDLLEKTKQKVKNLSDDRDTLTFIRSSLQKKIAEAREENDHVAEQLRKAEKDLADSLNIQQLQQQELEKTRDEVASLVVSFDEKARLMQVENDALIDDIRATRATAKRHRKKCQDMTAEKQQWETDKKTLENEIAALKDTVTSTGKNSEHEITVFKRQLTEAADLLQQQKDESSKQIEELCSKVAILEKENTGLKSKLSAEVKQAAEQKTSSTNKVSELSQLVQELQSKLQATGKENKELMNQLKNANKETKALLATAAELSIAKDNVETLEREKEELKLELASARKQSDDVDTSAWQHEKQQLSKDILKFQEAVRKLETDKKDMMDYMVELEDKLDKSETENAAKMSNAENDMKNLKSGWTQDKNRVSKLETETIRLKAEIDELKQSKDSLQKETNHRATLHSEEVQSFQKAYGDLQQELEQTKKERETIKETLLSEYEAKLSIERRKSITVNSEMTELRGQHSALEQKLAETKAEESRLRQQLVTAKLSSSYSSSSEESEVFTASTPTIEEEVEVDTEVDTIDGNLSNLTATQNVTKSPTSHPPPVSQKPTLKQTNSGSRAGSAVHASLQQAVPAVSSGKAENVVEEKSNVQQKDGIASPTHERTAASRSAFLANGHMKSSPTGSSITHPELLQLKNKPSAPASPGTRSRWEQVKTVVVSTTMPKPKATPVSQPVVSNVDRITALPGSKIAATARKFGQPVGRSGPGGNKLTRSKSFSPGSKGQSREQTKKEMLLRWCQSKTEGYQNVNITNFARSWNDGMAFCALMHHYFPDKIPFDTLKRENKAKNFELAFTVGEEEADIPQLLEVEDMVMLEVPDWMSVMTYVSVIYSHLASRDRKL